MKNLFLFSLLFLFTWTLQAQAPFPDLVTEKNGTKAICYDHFAVLSVEAIKEQQLEIEDLKKQLLELKALLTEANGK